MNIFTLTGTVLVDNAKANQSLSETGSQSEGLMTKVGNGIKTVATIGAAVVGAVGAGTAALYGMATKSAEATDRIDKLSQKIGLSRQAFQEWDFITSQSGMSVEQLQGGFKTLTAQMDKVTEGNKTATANFERLGISVTDNRGKLKSQEQVFEETVSALQGMEDGTEKARLATEIFGKSGSELMPLLNGASGSIEEMKAKAHELGLVLSDESIDAGVAFTDTVDQLKRSFGAVVTSVGTEVMPIMQKLGEFLIDNMPTIREVISAVFGVISEVVSVAGQWIEKFIGFVQNLVDKSKENSAQISDVWNTIKEMFATVFNGIIDVVKAFIDMFQAFWGAYGDTITIYIKGIWEQIKIVFETFFNVVIDIFNIFKALFSDDWEALWEGIKKLVSDIWDGVKKLIENSFTTILSVLISIGGKIKSAWNDVWEGVKTSLNNAWNNIKTSVSTSITNVVNSVKDMATKMINALKSLPNDALQMGKDFVQGLINGIANMISSVVDKAKSMASSVTSAVKSTLKIQSPSKVMTEAGEMVGEGLVVGIEKTTDNVNKAVDNMTSFKDKDLAIGSATGSSTASGGQVFNFYNTTIRSSKDIDTIQRQIYKSVVQANRTAGVGGMA